MRIAIMGVVLFGSVQSADLIWAIGDVGYASLAWINMLCLIFLAKPAVRALRDYDAQRRRGEDPVFDPEAAGIPGADYWVRGAAATEGEGGRSSRRPGRCRAQALER